MTLENYLLSNIVSKQNFLDFGGYSLSIEFIGEGSHFVKAWTTGGGKPGRPDRHHLSVSSEWIQKGLWTLAQIWIGSKPKCAWHQWVFERRSYEVVG